jgi:hypothetical protein
LLRLKIIVNLSQPCPFKFLHSFNVATDLGAAFFETVYTMDANSVAELRASLAKVPYQARWELLKPTIKRLYIDEGRRLADVADIIKKEYGFVALYVPNHSNPSHP